MSMTRSTWSSLLAIAPLLALAGCAEDDGDEGSNVVCAGAKCDAPTDPTKFACKNVVDESGRGRPNVLAELNDPISVFVLRGGSGCPRSYKETVAKLRTEDKVGCESSAAGMSTRFVTETGQLDGGKQNKGFRTVVSRRCNNRQEFELLFSLFGVPTSGQLPSAAEVVAFDPESKEFNYYEVGGDGKWHFFGSSSDFVEERGGRCKECHTGGGLVMKELDTPWLHWTGHFSTPGTTKVIDANKDDLGSESSGSNMESVTNQGNREWTKTRVTHALNPERSTVEHMLRPLFCTVEVNLDNASDFDTSPVNSLPADFLLDPKLKSFGSIGMKDDIYVAARTAAGVTVPGISGAADTLFKFPFIERSKSDIMYVDELVSRGVIDTDFVKDALMVDFTRPIFSDDRCSLLEFAPTFEQLEAGSAGTSAGEDTDPSAGETTGGAEESTGGGETTGAGTTDPTTGTGPAGNCCEADEGRQGCENSTIESCTCAADAFCCDNSWDATCVMLAQSDCNAVCGAAAVDDADLSLSAQGESVAAVDAKTIRELFIANIEASNPAAGSAAATFLASLKDTGDDKAHTDRVNAFLKACEDRDERAMMDDAFKMQTWQRKIAFTLPAFEFPATMPTTNLSVSNSAHWDAATCTVVQ